MSQQVGLNLPAGKSFHSFLYSPVIVESDQRISMCLSKHWPCQQTKEGVKIVEPEHKQCNSSGRAA